MIYIDILGYIGAFTLALITIPQIYTLYKSKSGDDLSFGMLGMMAFGYIIFEAYGILLPSIPIIASTLLSLFNLTILTAMKIYYARAKPLPITSSV